MFGRRRARVSFRYTPKCPRSVGSDEKWIRGVVPPRLAPDCTAPSRKPCYYVHGRAVVLGGTGGSRGELSVMSGM